MGSSTGVAILLTTETGANAQFGVEESVLLPIVQATRID